MISLAHRVNHAGAIQPAVFPRQRKTHHVGLGQPLEVLLNERVERDRAVLVERVPLAIDSLRVAGDRLGCHFADDFQHPPVIVDDVFSSTGR